ncbi:MAG: ATP-binding protein [Gammaproteobacteria bacterium]|nr:ATP-binding protein [Gammaproteobacteria bacterium]
MPDVLKPSRSSLSKQALVDEIERLREKLKSREAESDFTQTLHKTLSHAINIGYWEWDEIAQKPAYLSVEMAGILGVSQESLYQQYQCEKDYLAYLHPDDRAYYMDNINFVVRADEPGNLVHAFDYRVIRPDGEIRYVRETEYSVKKENGVITKSYGAIQDITIQQDSLRKLHKSEQRYSSLFSMLPLGIQEQNWSEIKKTVEKLKSEGVEDLKAYLICNQDLLLNIVDTITVTSVNDSLLKTYEADSIEDYIRYEESPRSWWNDQWADLYATEISALASSSKINYAEITEYRLDGSEFYIRLISSIAGGDEDHWERVFTIVEDITDRKRLEQQLNKNHEELELKVHERTRELANNEKRFRDFSSSTSDWFWEMNERLEFSYFSEGLEKFAGMKAGDLLGKKRSYIDIGGVEPEKIEAHLTTLQRHEPFRDFVYSRLVEGKETWVSISGQPVFDDAGNFTGYRGTGRNVTERKQLDQILLETTEQAKAANLAKSQFLATMSHELRTPMTGVIGFADLLLEDELASEARDKVKRIKKSANSLLVLLNDILDMSKVEAGKMEIENIDFNLCHLMAEAMSQIRHTRSTDKRLELHIDCGPRFPEYINSDPTRIRQVLINLVGNAIKFTKEGEIKVIGDLLENGENPPVIKISVKDTGIGMSDKTVEKLFTEFTQADASISRKYEGSGLGLAICLRLVRLMGGDIGVESSKGVGSLFWFTIPYKAATTDHIDKAVQPSDFKLEATRSLDILLAEDNRVNQFVIQKHLESYGHKVTIVGNGLEAVTAHENGNFDIILMDIRMPEMDGMQATQAIRKSSDKKSRIPILAITADAMKENIDSYYESGMNGYISKPIDKHEMALAMNKAIGADIHMPASGGKH